jgi:hypothetical protein
MPERSAPDKPRPVRRPGALISFAESALRVIKEARAGYVYQDVPGIVRIRRSGRLLQLPMADEAASRVI